MKNIHIIINPISGTASKDTIPPLVQDFLPDNRYNKHIYFTEYAGHASELTKKAIESNADYIIAAGGDGTINEVAKSMIHSNATLGIIPSGSGNGLARDLGIPLDQKKALEIIAKGNRICIDYCKANEHIFFCTCGFGFDALVSERFSEEKHRGSISYLKSIFSEYFKFHPEKYEITFDEETISEKAFLITCANTSQYGYNAYIAPHANIQDGKIDIVIISPMNPLEAGPMAIQLFTKQLDKNNKIRYYQSKSVIIKRKNSGIMHIDGDPVQIGNEIQIQVIPAGLNVIVPTKENRQNFIQAQITDIQSFFKEVVRWVNDIRP